MKPSGGANHTEIWYSPWLQRVLPQAPPQPGQTCYAMVKRPWLRPLGWHPCRWAMRLLPWGTSLRKIPDLKHVKTTRLKTHRNKWSLKKQYYKTAKSTKRTVIWFCCCLFVLPMPLLTWWIGKGHVDSKPLKVNINDFIIISVSCCLTTVKHNARLFKQKWCQKAFLKVFQVLNVSGAV